MFLINLPPRPHDRDNMDLWRLRGSVENLNEVLNDNFRTPFEEHYLEQFDWFEPAIESAGSILNVGCSWGRETFALFWIFQPSLAVGIDTILSILDEGRVQTRAERANQIKNLTNVIPIHAGNYLANNLEQVDEVEQWYEDNVPAFIKTGGRLEFYEADITNRDTIREPDNYFDLVYLRYVVDKILDSGNEQMVMTALENMRRLVKPTTGKVVIVTPSLSYNDITAIPNIEELINEAGLTIIQNANAGDLGYLEAPETEPKGFLCKVS